MQISTNFPKSLSVTDSVDKNYFLHKNTFPVYFSKRTYFRKKKKIDYISSIFSKRHKQILVVYWFHKWEISIFIPYLQCSSNLLSFRFFKISRKISSFDYSRKRFKVDKLRWKCEEIQKKINVLTIHCDGR